MGANAIRDAFKCGEPGCPCAREQGNVYCPAHDDGRPSLSVTEERDGKTLVKCLTRCEPEYRD